MILGNNDGKTAAAKVIETALESLRAGDYQVNHNSPFKGGHITRYFGDPENQIHSLQLEMNKILYMDDNEITYNPTRADKVQQLLKSCMENLVETMTSNLWKHIFSRESYKKAAGWKT